MDSFWYWLLGSGVAVASVGLAIAACKVFNFSPFAVWQRAQVGGMLTPAERAFFQIVKDGRSYATLGVASVLLATVGGPGALSWTGLARSAVLAILVAAARGVAKYMAASGDPASGVVSDLAAAIASRAGISDAASKPAGDPAADTPPAEEAPMPPAAAAFWATTTAAASTPVPAEPWRASLMDGSGRD